MQYKYSTLRVISRSLPPPKSRVAGHGVGSEGFQHLSVGSGRVRRFYRNLTRLVGVELGDRTTLRLSPRVLTPAVNSPRAGKKGDAVLKITMGFL